MFPDDAKQVKEMTNIPIRCGMIHLSHFGIIKLWSNLSNSERVHLFYIHSIYPEMIPFASDSLHSIQRKFIHITFIPVK